MQNWEFRVCPECDRLSELDAEACRCGYIFPQKPKDEFVAYPRRGPGSGPVNVPKQMDEALRELAMHHRLWHRQLLIYFALGFLCCFPWLGWFRAMLRLRMIRRSVLAQGVDILWWKDHYPTK